MKRDSQAAEKVLRQDGNSMTARPGNGRIPRRMLKTFVQQGRSTRRSNAYSVRYVEPLNKARTPVGERCVLAHRGWAGEMSDSYSILLGREELSGVGRRETTESSTVAGAVQNRHFQALQRELLIPDLFECGDTECESIS